MSLTHLENGGWAVSDLHRLSVYELDEDTGVLIEQALRGGTVSLSSPVLREALTSGVLTDAGSSGAVEPGHVDSAH
ncbi:actinodefensin-associated protein B [Actinomyces timonensis]|uniref:Actinodefensin-associated protein B n=1 Tax=Actinomyces timonensis TaxID=1288391 RepID=A0AAU8N5T7_9ACTO